MKQRYPRKPVVVSKTEIEHLQRAWRHFLNSDVMDIDPLAAAIERLVLRKRGQYADSSD